MRAALAGAEVALDGRTAATLPADAARAPLNVLALDPTSGAVLAAASVGSLEVSSGGEGGGTAVVRAVATRGRDLSP